MSAYDQVMLETSENNPGVGRKIDFGSYMRQQPVMLAMLAVLGVIFFLAVAGLSRIYHAQRDALGRRWFTRGLTDLKAERFDRAITEFRSALLYSRDEYAYQLNLAEALVGSKRSGEAYSYLVNLWERQPEDGVVNLELARIAAQRGETELTERYYHNTIYATWPSDQEGRRRDTRLELIEYLLSIGAKAQAQSELIALEENIGEDAAQQKRMGDLFLRAGDYEHALASYRLALKSDRQNEAAVAGAGLAAFLLGRYPLAERYLQTAVEESPNDRQSADRLKTTQLVLRMDPFRRQLSVAERSKLVVEAFSTAGRRLSFCVTPKADSASADSQPSLADSWAKMKPQVSESQLRRNPDLVEQAMDLVFEIERQTNATCGTSDTADLALLLISKLHEVN